VTPVLTDKGALFLSLWVLYPLRIAAKDQRFFAARVNRRVVRVGLMLAICRCITFRDESWRRAPTQALFTALPQAALRVISASSESTLKMSLKSALRISTKTPMLPMTQIE
jgi:hypothetical protein